MKYTFYLISIVLLNNAVIAQSINDLDLKDGFRSFKLGTSLNLFKNLSRNKDQYSKNPNVSEFTYIGDDVKEVAHIPVHDVSLSFFKNQLFSISVNFGGKGSHLTHDQYENIIAYLEAAYGQNWSRSAIDGYMVEGCHWIGKKVHLELARYDYSQKYNTDFDYVNGYIHIFDH
jgi:hypothetical protein